MSKILSKFSDFSVRYVSIIFAVSVFVTMSVLIMRILYGSGDCAYHIQLSIAYFDAFVKGIFYPNWMFEKSLGYEAVTAQILSAFNALFAFTELAGGLISRKISLAALLLVLLLYSYQFFLSEKSTVFIEKV